MDARWFTWNCGLNEAKKNTKSTIGNKKSCSCNPIVWKQYKWIQCNYKSVWDNARDAGMGPLTLLLPCTPLTHDSCNTKLHVDFFLTVFESPFASTTLNKSTKIRIVGKSASSPLHELRQGKNRRTTTPSRKRNQGRWCTLRRERLTVDKRESISS